MGEGLLEAMVEGALCFEPVDGCDFVIGMFFETRDLHAVSRICRTPTMLVG